MNDINRCPNHELLVTYLYDECEPAERELVAAHLALCASCAEDVQGLRDARVHLAAWSPPALPLGFQLTRTESEHPSKVLRPAAWWREPLPAWAQAAAAVVIFAGGMSLGAVRSGDRAVENAAAGADTRASISAPVVATAADTVSRDDFERLEARLRSIEGARTEQVQLARNGAGAIDQVLLARMEADALKQPALIAQVTAMVDNRVTERDRQTLGRIDEDIRRLDDRYAELSTRTEMLEEDSEGVREVFNRGFGPSSMIRPASLTGVR